MKTFITIELELDFSNEDTKSIDEELKRENKTFNYHITNVLKQVLVNEANIEPEHIKNIIVNRID